MDPDENCLVPCSSLEADEESPSSGDEFTCHKPYIKMGLPKLEVRVKKVDSEVIDLKWEQIQEAEEYEVTFIKKMRGEEQRFHCLTKDTNFSIPGVLPFHKYEIYVKASGGEESDPSFVTAGPSEPKNVEAAAEPSSPCDSIKVTFENPDEIPESYKVVIVDTKYGQERAESKLKKTFAIFRDLDPGRTYEIYVQSVIKNPYPGPEELFSRKVYAPSETMTYPAKVTLTSAEYIGKGVAELGWDLTEGATSYEVNWTDGVQDIKKQKCFTKSTKIRGLASGKTYTIVVVAISKAGEGPRSNPKEIKTEPSPPASMKVTHFPSSPHTALLVSLEESVADGKKFSFIAKPLRQGGKEKQVTSDFSHALIEDLVPGDVYQICAVATQDNLISEESVCPDLVYMYPDQPNGVKALVSYGSLKVMWDELQVKPTKYLIEIEENEVVQTKYSETSEIIRRNIKPSAIYYIRVAGVNDAGRGRFSNKVTLYTDPVPPTNPRVAYNRASPKTSLLVTFDDRNAVSSHYIITAIPAVGNDKIENITNEKSVVLYGLSPGKKYSVQVRAFVDYGDGKRKYSDPVYCLPK